MAEFLFSFLFVYVKININTWASTLRLHTIIIRNYGVTVKFILVEF